MSAICKFIPVHGIVANAPATVMLMASHPVMSARMFKGVGAPSSSTLQTGNARYCASTSGYILAVTAQAGGSGYAVGDVLTVSGGTFTAAAVVTVDAVTASGAILDWHVSTVGAYSVYPSNPVSMTGGSGTGATFNLAFQPPDFYLDTNAKSLYACTTSGSNSTSVWAQISGGSSGWQQFKIVSDGGDWWVCKSWDGTTLGTNPVNIFKPPKLRCGAMAITTETIRGVVQNYAYALQSIAGLPAYYIRTVTVGGNVIEKDVVIPDPLANDLLDALPHPNLPTQVSTIAVNNGGTSGTYAPGDVLTLAGGTGTAATLTVATVSAGQVVTVNLTTAGSYTAPPSLTGCAVTGGGGTGATFNLSMMSGLRALADGRAWSEI